MHGLLLPGPADTADAFKPRGALCYKCSHIAFEHWDRSFEERQRQSSALLREASPLPHCPSGLVRVGPNRICFCLDFSSLGCEDRK